MGGSFLPLWLYLWQVRKWKISKHMFLIAGVQNYFDYCGVFLLLRLYSKKTYSLKTLLTKLKLQIWICGKNDFKNQWFWCAVDFIEACLILVSGCANWARVSKAVTSVGVNASFARRWPRCPHEEWHQGGNGWVGFRTRQQTEHTLRRDVLWCGCWSLLGCPVAGMRWYHHQHVETRSAEEGTIAHGHSSARHFSWS